MELIKGGKDHNPKMYDVVIARFKVKGSLYVLLMHLYTSTIWFYRNEGRDVHMIPNPLFILYCNGNHLSLLD